MCELGIIKKQIKRIIFFSEKPSGTDNLFEDINILGS
jgi:hypothetical protein